MIIGILVMIIIGELWITLMLGIMMTIMTSNDCWEFWMIIDDYGDEHGASIALRSSAGK